MLRDPCSCRIWVRKEGLLNFGRLWPGATHHGNSVLAYMKLLLCWLFGITWMSMQMSGTFCDWS